MHLVLLQLNIDFKEGVNELREKKRIVCYINQFFGQVGGEEKADVGFSVVEGAAGPALLVQSIVKEDAEVVATIICGDNYMSENLEESVNEGILLVDKYKPDLFIAGPAFNAGRYGVACAGMASAVSRKYNIPVVTGMYQDNPGVELCRKDCYVMKTGISAGEMRKAIPTMVNMGLRLLNGDKIGSAKNEQYFPRNIIKNENLEENGARRAIDMLMAKIKGEDFNTELKVPEYEPITPAPPVSDIKSAKIAIVSDGGITPNSNPDNFKVSQNTVWAKYKFEDIMSEFRIMHSGYHPSEVKSDINRLLPKDALDLLQEQGEFGEIYPYLYSTSGNTTTVQSSRNVGSEMAQDLLKEGITAVILTST